jgi:uncharacterized membrane protein
LLFEFTVELSVMLAVELLLRWTHILAAIALAGGTIFRRFALLPAVAELPADARQQLAAGLRSRWSKVVMISSGLLLLTGLVNFMMIVTRFDIPKTAFPGSLYHMLFGIKFLLALVVFVLAALLTGRTALAERLRQNEKFWLSLNMLLAIILVCLGGLLKVAERQPKAASANASSALISARAN